MESYQYKPKNDEFPKIMTNSSTWYKTFNLNKTQNNSMGNLNASNLLKNNTNNKIVSQKNIFQKINSKNNSSRIYQKNSKKRIIQKSRPSSVNYRLSEEETDDSIFALSQIKDMDHLIAKRTNKNLVWKEKPRKIYDFSTSRNDKDIRRIRHKIHETRFEPSKNFDLRSEIDKKKYFPLEKVDIINDASDIMKKMENQINERKVNKFFIKRRVDIQTFAKQNRDICLKNNLINVIKEESNKLKIREQDISKALKKANIIFNKDKKEFETFLIISKDKIKQEEIMLEEAAKNNKILVEEIHRLNSELRSNQDETERNIRDIILFYSYAEFIHRIINNGKPLKKVNINKLNIHQNRTEGKDLKYIVNNAFEQFDSLLNENHINTKTQDLDFDVEQMTYLFNSMENSILKLMNERDNILKEIQKEKQYNELNFLQNKIIEHEKELNYLKKEINKMNKQYEPINEEAKKNLLQGQKYIFEIYQELKQFFIDEEQKITNMEILSRETINYLHKLENKLLFYMNEMESIKGNDKEPDELFKDILENVKIENKNKKIKSSRLILQKLEEEKKLKYQKRMNRVKIRSVVEFPPPWIQKKKKENKKPKIDEKNNDEGLIFY